MAFRVVTASLVIGMCAIVIGAHLMTRAEEIKPLPCMDEATRDKVRGITLKALDDALEMHIEHMFAIWMKDHYHQPERAVTGIRNGVSAYLGARSGAIAWDPELCK